MNRGDMKMKDIKSYVIGFLTCACMFLIMGQTKSEKSDDNGRFQPFANPSGLYLYEKKTGHLWGFKKTQWHPITGAEPFSAIKY